MREALLQAVLAEGRAPDLLATAAADVEQQVRDLVVVAVLAERNAGAPCVRIGEAGGTDAARHPLELGRRSARRRRNRPSPRAARPDVRPRDRPGFAAHPPRFSARFRAKPQVSPEVVFLLRPVVVKMPPRVAVKMPPCEVANTPRQNYTKVN
jgi:hypothetical protein